MSSPRAPFASRARQRGYALLLVLMLALMGGLYGLTQHLDPALLKSRQVQASAAALKLAKEALIGFAATYRDTHDDEVFGYLPCPDLTGDGVTDPSCGDSGQPAVGLLPYRSLGLSDLRDADGNCLWYAVSGGFKNSPKAPPLNWDTQGQFSIQDANGTTLAAPDDANGGAAAIVFAPGAPLAGQNRGAISQPCGASPAEVAAYLEGSNNRYTQGNATDANDRLTWITPKEIFARIEKRHDFAAFVGTGINNIHAKLGAARAPAGADNGLPTANPFNDITQASDHNFYANWIDHFRYLPCATPGAYCYQDASARRHDGVLLFGGTSSSGNPRRSTARALTDYFEAPTLALAQGGTSQPCSANPAVFDNGSATGRAADIALCLWPQPDVPVQVIDTADNAQFARLAPIVAAQPVALRDDANHRLQLGQTGTAAPLYGCIWYPTVQTLGDLAAPINLRAYFRFYIDKPGDGFTFAIADAATNPSPAMCGASGPDVGYAGNNGSTAPIKEPKIAVEFDRKCDADHGDPLCASTYRQMAFVYWGDAATLDDDNTHGVGSPLNPANGSDGFKKSTASSFLANRKMQYLRFEMQRSYDVAAHRATHVLRAYVTGDLGGAGCLSSDFSDLGDDLENINPFCFGSGPTLSDSIVIDDVGGAPAMKNVWLGFTVGQGSQDQRVYVYDLQTRIAP